MKELTNLLEKLANKLGTTVEHLWEVLKKQAEVEFICRTVSYIVGIFIIVICSFGVKWAIVGIMKLNDYNKDVKMWNKVSPEGYWILAIVGSLIIISFIVVMLCELSMYIATKKNPEYWALKQIINRY